MNTRIVFGSPQEDQLPERGFPLLIPEEYPYELNDLVVLLDQTALAQINRHADFFADQTGPGQSVECAGLLAGRAFRDAQRQLTWVAITTIVEMQAESQSAGSVRIIPAAFKEARQKIDNQGLMLVGWYHTHPNFGIFLSNYDRLVTRSVFNASWHIALVFDPIRKEIGCFYGPDGIRVDDNDRDVPIKNNYVVISDWKDCWNNPSQANPPIVVAKATGPERSGNDPQGKVQLSAPIQAIAATDPIPPTETQLATEQPGFHRATSSIGSSQVPRPSQAKRAQSKFLLILGLGVGLGIGLGIGGGWFLLWQRHVDQSSRDEAQTSPAPRARQQQANSIVPVLQAFFAQTASISLTSSATVDATSLATTMPNQKSAYQGRLIDRQTNPYGDNRIVVQVVDEQQNPLVGIKIDVWAHEVSPNRLIGSGVTDAEGRYDFNWDAHGQLYVNIVGAASAPLPVLLPTEAQIITLELKELPQ